MKYSHFFFSALAGLSLAMSPIALSQIVISEFEPNPAGGDPDPTFIELSGGTPNEAFDLWLISIEGDDNSTLNTLKRVFNITGVFDANGLATPGIDDFENPSFTLALLSEPTVDPTVGDDLDPDNDGILDFSTLGTVLDSIGIPDNAADETFSNDIATALGGSTFPAIGSEPRLAFRDGMTGEWYAVSQDGSSVFNLAGEDVLETGVFSFNPGPIPTVGFGTVNPVLENTPTLLITNDTIQISETESFPSFITLTPSQALESDLTVTVTYSNSDRVSITADSDTSSTINPTSITIPAAVGSVELEVNFINNSLSDGNVLFTLDFSAAGFAGGSTNIGIMDDDSPAPELVINEIQTDAAGAGGPDFIELYNGSSAAIDLSGYSVQAYQSSPDSGLGTESINVTLPNGTTIAPGGFYLIGGDDVTSIYGATPDLSVPDFDINDSDVSVSLVDPISTPVYTVLLEQGGTIPNIAGTQVVSDLNPGVDSGGFGPSGYYLLTDGGTEAATFSFTANDSPAPEGTPGRSNETQRLVLSATPISIAEDSSETVEFTLTGFPVLDSDLVVTLSNSLSDELDIPATVTIPANTSSITFSGTPQIDSASDGAQSTIVEASVTGYESSNLEITVLDVDAPLSMIMINEVLNSTTGADTEFIELFNPDTVNTVDLTGFTITIYESQLSNSAFGNADRTLMIESGMIAPGGLFLIASPAFAAAYPSTTIDADIANNFIENDAVTIVLRDVNGRILYTAFLNSLGDGGQPVIDDISTPAAFDISVDSSIGYFLNGNGASTAEVQNGDVPSTTATPSADNVAIAIEDFAVSVSTVLAVDGAFTLNFTATGPVDIYRSTDLVNFGTTPIATNVSETLGSYTDMAAPAGKAFYILVEAGAAAP